MIESLTRRKVLYGSVMAAILVSFFAMVSPLRAAEPEIEVREVEAFSRIETRGSFLLEIKVGDPLGVEIEAEPRDLRRIDTEVVDERLIITYDERFFSFFDGSRRTVRIGMPTLENLVLTGEADATVTGIDREDFSVFIAGSADVSLEGSCRTLKLELSGSGDVIAHKLECEDVSVLINGAGDTSVFASSAVSVVINGLGDVDVYGSPAKVDERINGLGSVDMK